MIKRSDLKPVDEAVDGRPKNVPEVGPRAADERSEATRRPREIGGPKGPEPTRYGDWEKNGRCIDF